RLTYLRSRAAYPPSSFTPSIAKPSDPASDVPETALCKPHVSRVPFASETRTPFLALTCRRWRRVVACSNGTHASRQFLSFLLRWRQPRPRNRSISKEERQPRAPPPQLPRLTQRLPLTQRQHRARRPCHRHRRQEPRRRWPHRELRHTSPHGERRRTLPTRGPRRRWPPRELRRTSPHRVTRLCKLAARARRKRAALGRSPLPVRRAARPPRPWRGMRRRREPLRFRRSNSRKSPAAIPAAKPEPRWAQ